MNISPQATALLTKYLLNRLKISLKNFLIKKLKLSMVENQNIISQYVN